VGKINNRLLGALVVGILGLLAAVGCSNSSGTADKSEDTLEQKEKTIRIAYNLPAEHATGLYFERLAEEINKRTANTSIHLKPKTFPNGQLYNDAQLPDSISTGGAEIGQLNVGFLAGDAVEPLRILDLPFLFNSWEAEWAAEDGKYGELFGKQLEKFNMKLLGWPMYGTIELYGNFSIKAPEDLQGKKMRAFGKGAALMLEEMGAAPVSMSSQEIYQAMEHGVIEGYTTGPSSVVDRSLYEVTEYGTNMIIMYVPFQSVANMDWWNSLPEDVQQAVAKASQVAQEASRQAAKKSDDEYKQKIEEYGVEQYKPTPEEFQQWVESVKGRHDEYLKNTGELGKKLMEAAQKANEQHGDQ
jgi:C4-dicarboxylate-binding protein DctP